jgi:hypothetical protein
MPTLEHQAIIDELRELRTITNKLDVAEDIRYNVKNFYYFSFLGYKMRLERRKMRASDLRVGIGAIVFSGLMSLMFAFDNSLIPLFIQISPFIWVISIVGTFAAALRKIRLSDWFVLIYLASYMLAAVSLLPVLFLGDTTIPTVFAAMILFSVSFAMFLNLAFAIYILRVNRLIPVRFFA